jgi:hypothetical protein
LYLHTVSRFGQAVEARADALEVLLVVVVAEFQEEGFAVAVVDGDNLPRAHLLREGEGADFGQEGSHDRHDEDLHPGMGQERGTE